jgi:hypothetical protein
MKYLLFAFGPILFWGSTKAQEAENCFEFGSTLFTVNSFGASDYYPLQRAPVEIMNGIFFRYSKNRIGFRAHSSYSENSSTYFPPPNTADRESGELSHKDFRIGGGIQYDLLKNKKWLYGFIDLSYRNVFSEGLKSGGFSGQTYKYYSTTNGMESFFGLGFKIKAIKNVYLSPELGYLLDYGFEKTTSTSLNSSTYGKTTESTSNNVNLNAICKLHLTVRF